MLIKKANLAGIKIINDIELFKSNQNLINNDKIKQMTPRKQLENKLLEKVQKEEKVMKREDAFELIFCHNHVVNIRHSNSMVQRDHNRPM